MANENIHDKYFLSSQLYLLIYSLISLSSVNALSKPILAIGSSGGTGIRALRGLLDVGYKPSDIRILTRSPNKPLVQSLSKLGFIICEGDLDWTNNDSKQKVIDALDGCAGCYIHSLSSDTKQLDRSEVARAMNLQSIINNVPVVYNSAAGETNHRVERIQQKHDVEAVFKQKFTSLRANLFMEELWKSYTRPSILKGVFPFGTQPHKKIYLTSVRDMGRLAACILQNPQTFEKRVINVAGDVLTAVEIADRFANAQHSECVHKDSKVLRLVSRVFFRDLYQIIRFYRNTVEVTDIHELKREFGDGYITDFSTFLLETNWDDRSLTFDDLSNVEILCF